MAHLKKKEIRPNIGSSECFVKSKWLVLFKNNDDSYK